MLSTMEKYHEFVMTGFLKRVQPVVISSAQGALVRDESGREFVDCFSGISVVNAGHCNPAVLEAAKAQMEKLVHCCSYMYHNSPTADLAEKMPNTYSGGYFDGYVQGLVEGKAQDETLCIPDGVVQGQIAEAVRKYLRDHPEELHLHAVPLIVKAIQAAWPCSK